jgi:hypothetical protein
MLPLLLTRAIIEPDQFDEKLAGGGRGPTICSVASWSYDDLFVCALAKKTLLFRQAEFFQSLEQLCFMNSD